MQTSFILSPTSGDALNKTEGSVMLGDQPPRRGAAFDAVFKGVQHRGQALRTAVTEPQAENQEGQSADTEGCGQEELSDSDENFGVVETNLTVPTQAKSLGNDVSEASAGSETATPGSDPFWGPMGTDKILHLDGAKPDGQGLTDPGRTESPDPQQSATVLETSGHSVEQAKAGGYVEIDRSSISSEKLVAESSRSPASSGSKAISKTNGLDVGLRSGYGADGTDRNGGALEPEAGSQWPIKSETATGRRGTEKHVQEANPVFDPLLPQSRPGGATLTGNAVTTVSKHEQPRAAIAPAALSAEMAKILDFADMPEADILPTDRGPGELNGPTPTGLSALASTGLADFASLRADTLRNAAARTVEVFLRQPGKPVEISLNPEELGRVRMSLSTSDAGISVSITSDRPETLDLMRRHIDQLAQEFQRLGYENTAFQFGHDSGRSAGSNETTETPPTEPTDTVVPTIILSSRLVSTGLDLRL